MLALVAAACTWGEEGAIRARLKALAQEANKPPAEGLALVTHAAAVGGYFSGDAVVDLGPGSAPLQGRETLIGMVARLQPRLAAYRLELEDVEVHVSEDKGSAGVSLTLRTIPRRPGSSEGPDAREFALEMRKEDGEWRIARATAVQTLR